MNNEPTKPYDPQHPDMPPLINDVIYDKEKFDAEAEEVRRCRANQAKAEAAE